MNKENNLQSNPLKVKGSFRDPSGSLYIKDGILYRKITPVYYEHYKYAKNSGLYEALMKEGLLIHHYEDEPTVIVPQKIPFISYPYEWCFSQLKDAALLTLKIQKRALDFDMILKDASAFNVQFLQGKPIFIDTLSFEKYEEGSPWVGYRQFCQQFLGPLLLMKYRDLRMNQISRIFIDGPPLDLISTLLPLRTFLNPLSVFHIHLHAKSQKKFGEKRNIPTWRISKKNLIAFIDNLESGIHCLTLKKQKTEWQNYYQKTNYSELAFKDKKRIVGEFLETLNAKTVWDLGANTGEFSRLASQKGAEIISFDIDPMTVEENYLEIKKKGEKNLLTLVMDFTNPSSGLGWENEERMSLTERGPVDAVMALALVHHLAISNNVPLSRIAEYFSKLGRHLIVEFVPKTDTQVKKLLATRKDIFPAYEQTSFEKEFSQYFVINRRENIADSERLLYLMKKKSYD